MKDINDADGAIRAGEPPVIPGSRRASQWDSPRQPRLTLVVKCLWPLALGCLFSGCTAANQIPASVSVEDRVLVFVAMMAGPFCAPILLGPTDLSYSPIQIFLALGVLSIPLIAAYPVKQSLITACLSVMGLAFWFWAGFISVIYCYYAG
jgi:hypothetical protein